MDHFYGAIFVIFGACEGEYSIRIFIFSRTQQPWKKRIPTGVKFLNCSAMYKLKMGINLPWGLF